MFPPSSRSALFWLVGLLLVGVLLFWIFQVDTKLPSAQTEAVASSDSVRRTPSEVVSLRPQPPTALPVQQPSIGMPDQPRPIPTPSAHPPVTPTLAPPTTRFNTGKAGFVVRVKKEVVPYRVFGVFVMPGETVRIEAVSLRQPGQSRFVAEGGAGEVTLIKPDQWSWKAPEEKGLYPIHITDATTKEQITLNVFVMVPFDHKRTSLNGYDIGRYEQKPLRGNPAYNPPSGFIELTPDNQDVPVSPHFTLGQFQCKQTGGYPKYMLLNERLVLKIEMLLEAVNQQGFAVNTFHVMSGFRTPQYNVSIGNKTTYSSHLYGSAADIFIDADDDGYMDDLDRDGAVTTEEASLMARIVEDKGLEASYKPFIGGLGIYSPASHRGPFIHVDVRGQKARW